MPKGLKETSGLIVISTGLAESGANTFTQSEVDLQLNVLDREVFVCLAVDINIDPPELNAAGGDSDSVGSLSTTSRTSVGSIADNNVIAVSRRSIEASGGLAAACGFDTQASETPSTNLDYMGIIATNNFFIQVQGVNNTNPKNCQFRMWGYRAQASADTYAALVQSELLSS